MAVLPYQGIYIGFPTVFNPFGAIPPPATNFTRINQIEMAVSRDLYHWERVADRTPFIGIEPFDGHNYGTSQLLMSGPPVVRDDGEPEHCLAQRPAQRARHEGALVLPFAFAVLALAALVVATIA